MDELLREVFCAGIRMGYGTVECTILNEPDPDNANEFLDDHFYCGMRWQEITQEHKLRSLKKVYNERETIILEKSPVELQAAALYLLIDFQTTISPCASLDYWWFWGECVEMGAEETDVAKYLDSLYEKDKIK